MTSSPADVARDTVSYPPLQTLSGTYPPTPTLLKTIDLNEKVSCTYFTKCDTLNKMGQAVHNSGITYGNNNRNCGNSNNIEYNHCNISVPDEKRQILEWISPFASRERHQSIRDSRVEKVGDWLLCNESFSTWRTSGDRTAKPVLFCHGNPGAGKTYIRYEPP